MSTKLLRLAPRIWKPSITPRSKPRHWQQIPSRATTSATPLQPGQHTSIGAKHYIIHTDMKRPMGGHARAGDPGGGGNHHRRKFKKSKKEKAKDGKNGSSEDVLMADIQAMLARQRLTDEDDHRAGTQPTETAESEPKTEAPLLPEQGSEIDVKVAELSSTGDGLALQKGSSQIYVVPFVLPGDTVRIRVYRHMRGGYSIGDFLSVVTPSPQRDDSRIQCKYFAVCAGCQLQPMAYADQLEHKRRIVEKAFANFSDLPPELVPAVGETVGSPLQYGYRTKLTPHFDGPPGHRSKGSTKTWEAVPDIGFMPKVGRQTMDIEDCPIGTVAVRKGMKRERERMAVEFGKYSRGATILLRESTKRYRKASSGETLIDADDPPQSTPADAERVETETHVDIKTCITDNNAISTEYVDDYRFDNPAGAFFQNNNSILPVFTSYIRDHIMPLVDATATTTTSTTTTKPIRNLIDAYSGSGLFTITLSPLFASAGGRSVGIDIADQSIRHARRNAAFNGLGEGQCGFHAADAPELFRSVGGYDPDATAVVVDPPRKGCDASFLRQLLAFAPRRVVYVSCNVHTQARDVGALVRGHVDGEAPPDGGGARYSIESLRGFDFFPQTGHVEGVAVLNRVGGVPSRAEQKDGAEAVAADAAASALEARKVAV